MGLKSFLFGPRPLKLDHLLNGKINLARKGSLSTRVNFAWEAYTGKNEVKYKNAAFNFLVKTFKIPPAPIEEQQQKLQALMALKQKNSNKDFMPDLSDLTSVSVAPPPSVAAAKPSDNLKLTTLTMIQPPKPTPKPAAVPPPTPTKVSSDEFDESSQASNDNEASLVLNDDEASLVFNGDDASQNFDDDDEPSAKDKLGKFIAEVNLEMEKLNVLIESYNRATDKTEKTQILFTIHQEQKRINNLYPADIMNACKSYRDQFHSDLFKEIQKQFKLLGFPSVNDDFLKQHLACPTIPPDPSSLAEIIANMSPEKANKMLELLSKGRIGDLKGIEKLFAPNEPGYADYQRFLATHKIEFLGGNNSRNYKVTTLANGEEWVLKVDNRLDAPKDAEALLRASSLRDVLSPVYADRTATHGESTRTLLVTDFCKGGNLEEHGNKMAKDRERAQSALNIYTQMGIILKNLSTDGCAFPDMKNSNWLVNERGILQIADTKSFAFTNEGMLDFTTKANRWYSILSTPFMSPPEISLRASADKMHSFMLGKNLYQYLSGCPCSYIDNKNNAALFDFSQPIFSTPEGQEFQELIKATVHMSPAKRISMDIAVERLQAIESKVATREMLKGLKDLNEPTLADFIREKEELVHTATKIQLISLQEDIKIKITEAQELKIARQTTGELLTGLKNLNEPTFAEFIREKEEFIRAATKGQLASLQEHINIKRTEANELREARQEARVLLDELQHIDEHTQGAFIRTQEILINTANKEQLAALQQDIQNKITEAALQEARIECRNLLQELKTETRDKNSAKNMLSQFEKRIEAAPNRTEVIKIKAEIETKLTFAKALNSLHDEAPGLLEQIKARGLGEKDIAMHKYIKKKMDAITNVKDKEGAEMLLDELKVTLAKLQEPQQIKEITVIKDIAKSLRSKSGWGYKSKADKIEAAVCRVPISERGHIQEGNTLQTTEVLKALAFQSQWHKKDIYLTKDGKINEKQAPQSFKDFKKAMSNIKDKAATPESNIRPTTLR